MVAKITLPGSFRRALNYNEQKMKEGKAECIYAHGFIKDADQLNFFEKLERLQDLINLNKRASSNTLHISLNFGLNEKLNQHKLAEIATLYMEKIGFGQQPYLVYEHLDTGHPHIHIVTTSIQRNGKRIPLHNIGKNQSDTARKEIEKVFRLEKAEGRSKLLAESLSLTQRVIYGKSATKRGITNVLDVVLPHYKYGSLPELNAVLKLYNVSADRGKEDSVIYQKRGLVYRVLDENGNKIGVPIKASSIYNRPTLDFLENRFRENAALKIASSKKSLQTAIDWIMIRPPNNLQSFQQALARVKINLVIRRNEDGVIYGLTYVDHNTKCVYNGSELGKDYSANAILEKLSVHQYFIQKSVGSNINLEDSNDHHLTDTYHQAPDVSNIINALILPTEELNYLPHQLITRKKKKRITHRR